jgi:hypothetical protein
MDYINRDNRILFFGCAYSAHSNNIQSFGAVFMIYNFYDGRNYFFIITNLSAALITPTLLSRLNNGKYSVFDIRV